MRCLTVHNFYQRRGGEDVVFEAETAMLRQAGHAVESFTLHNDELAAKSKLGSLALTLWNGEAYRALQGQIARFRPHVIHFHNTFPLMSSSVLSAARQSKAAVVMTLHNFRLLCPSANLYRNGAICTDCLPRTIKWPGVLHRCYRGSRMASGAVASLSAFQYLTGSLNGVDRFITLSRAAQDQFLAAGFPADRLVVKPNFIPPPPEPLVRQPRERMALYVGRLVAEKGLHTLLQAWHGPDAPQIPLAIVGEGPLALPADSGDGRIMWLGRRDPAEVHSLMRRASLLIFPSEWCEPFGLTIIEAFANGLPVVAARIGAPGELVDPGITGATFEPGSAAGLAKAVRNLLDSPEQLDAMGRHAQDVYRWEFSPERNLERLNAIYRDAMRSARRHPSALPAWVSARTDMEAG
jgi:glycosyltransferase involved in cell wall biosynthesis